MSGNHHRWANSCLKFVQWLLATVFLVDGCKSTLVWSNKVCICSRSVSIFYIIKICFLFTLLSINCCNPYWFLVTAITLCPRNSSISSHEGNNCYRMLLTEINSSHRQPFFLQHVTVPDIVTVLFHWKRGSHSSEALWRPFIPYFSSKTRIISLIMN
jgi:hypothetical protein